MSSRHSSVDAGHGDVLSPSQNFDEGDGSESNIPKRVMRVKVLYTFDNENKTNCLTRLGKPIPISVVALDESTEIGIIQLRTCIQAIVAASPEMMARLENDYTVYAYDFSEYETPLVGQGMLSWVLATASPTPSAPASQSSTMVTGRVCRNIMGLFASGGIKETLEVKLKLVPVPTRSRSEYLQSMSVYRDPSIVMPDGFDNNAWNSFLQAIPNAGMLGGDSATSHNLNAARPSRGGIEQLHDMLTPRFGPDDDMFSNGPGSSRPGSPTPSQRSVPHHQMGYSQSQPGLRASFHHQQNDTAIDDQAYDECHAKKRARLTQADWHGRGSFGANADSLRVAVSTSASIRDFRPSAVGNTSASGEMVPRAPTPRATEKRGERLAMPRTASNLRRQSASADCGFPYAASEDTTRLDSGNYSLDYDGGSSRQGSPSPDLPSSPPEYTPIEQPSSPLPELPRAHDSGFQSDIPQPEVAKERKPMRPPINKSLQRKARGIIEWASVQPGPQENLPTTSFPNFDPLSQKSALAAQWNKQKTSPAREPANQRGGRASSKANRNPPLPQPRQTSTTPVPHDALSPGMLHPYPSIERSGNALPVEQPSICPPPGSVGLQPYTRQQDSIKPNAVMSSPEMQRQSQNVTSATGKRPASRNNERNGSQGPTSTSVVLPPRNAASRQGQWPQQGYHPPKSVLERSQTWTAGSPSDVESDNGNTGAVAEISKGFRPRSGSGLVRSKSINNQLDYAVSLGKPVRHCRNCGQIKTPTWRPYWVKDEAGDGKSIVIGTTTGIHMIEQVDWNEQGEAVKVKVYKQYAHLTQEEKTSHTYEQYYFCNPCGDYIRKHSKIRPRDMWDPSAIPKIRRRKKRKVVNGLTSDLPAPSSEWDIPGFTDPFMPSDANYGLPDGNMDYFQSTAHYEPIPFSEAELQCLIATDTNQQAIFSTPAQQTAPNNISHPKDNDPANVAALQKAIQSSPARILGSHDSPIEIADGISPKPTRRLLFPSPRKDGEFKSLEKIAAEKAEAKRSGVTPAETPKSSKPAATPSKDVDKENLRPTDDDDEFAHLFDEAMFQSPQSQRFKTPTKAQPRTPLSKSRTHLSTGLTPRSVTRSQSTPRTSSKRKAEPMGPPDTPSHKRRSPRLAEKQSHQKEMTPFTKSLTQLLSDGFPSSPSRLGSWTLTSSPAKNLNSAFGAGAGAEENMWSDFPMPSSPPFFNKENASAAEGVDYDWSTLGIWEDGTATEGVKGWDGIFDEERRGSAAASGATLQEAVEIEGDVIAKKTGVEVMGAL